MSNKAISSNDTNAIEKLSEKLESCEKLQAVMKATGIQERGSGTNE